MFRAILNALIVVLTLTFPAQAQDRVTIGYGRLVTNDLIGDGRDRWQTGSVASSRVRAPGWDGVLPRQPGALLEYRFGAAIMAPANLRDPAAADRPYAGALSLGLHTHFERGGVAWAIGGDLVVTGPQTRLGDFQTALHDLLRLDPATPGVLSGQAGNAVHPTLVAEAGHNLQFGRAQVRPFAELRWGAETLARAGVDVTFGGLGAGELLVRDPVTGQRYRAVTQPFAGFGLVMGADIAHLRDSVFLPDSSGVTAQDTRRRARAGLHWQGAAAEAFYGLSWLGEEFEGQSDGQVVGSVRLKLAF